MEDGRCVGGACANDTRTCLTSALLSPLLCPSFLCRLCLLSLASKPDDIPSFAREYFSNFIPEPSADELHDLSGEEEEESEEDRAAGATTTQ